MREIERALKRFDASLEWLMERNETREKRSKRSEGMEELERGRRQKLGSTRMRSIADVLGEVGVLVDQHFFNEISEIKTSIFLKKVIGNQSMIDMSVLKKPWRSLNCTPKTMKVIREIRENLPWV